MSANFLDKRAYMLGWDDHLYLFAAGKVPVPKFDHPHGVYADYASFDNGKHTTTVTSEGQYMLPADWEKEVVPHMPVPVPIPHPAEAALAIYFSGTGKSKSRMKASTVTGQGRALTCCVLGAVGWSANCSGSGVIVQSNTVVTSPTAGDYVEMAVGYALDKFLGGIVDGLLEGVPEPLASAIEKGLDLIKDPVVEWTQEKARELTESMEEAIDDLL